MLLVILLACIWGTSFLLSKDLIAFTSPGAAVFQRVFWALIGALLISLVSGFKFSRWSLTDITKNLCLGALSIGIPFSFLFLGLPYLPSSVASLLNGLVPTMVLFITFLRKKPISVKHALIAIFLSTTGITLLTGNIESFSKVSLDFDFFKGCLFLMIMNLSYAVANSFYSNFKTHHKLSQALIVQFSGALIIIYGTFFKEVHSFPLIHELTSYALVLGVINTAIAFLIYWYVVDRYGGVLAAQSPVIAPIVAVIISIFFGETQPALSYLLGAILIISAVRFSQIAVRKA